MEKFNKNKYLVCSIIAEKVPPLALDVSAPRVARPTHNTLTGISMKLLNLLMALLTMTITHAQANTCSATSGAQRVALLELYTSEGCDSCPPTDRWVSALATRGFAGDRVIPLAFHVDYWNYLGWKDPFAQARYTERQRFVNARVRTRTIYTPQLMLDG